MPPRKNPAPNAVPADPAVAVVLTRIEGVVEANAAKVVALDVRVERLEGGVAEVRGTQKLRGEQLDRIERVTEKIPGQFDHLAGSIEQLVVISQRDLDIKEAAEKRRLDSEHQAEVQRLADQAATARAEGEARTWVSTIGNTIATHARDPKTWVTVAACLASLATWFHQPAAAVPVSHAPVEIHP